MVPKAKEKYIAPKMMVYHFCCEQGFAGSDTNRPNIIDDITVSTTRSGQSGESASWFDRNTNSEDGYFNW